MIIGNSDNAAQVRYPTSAVNNAGAGAIAWSINGVTHANDSIICELNTSEAMAVANNVTNANYSQRLFLTDFDFDIPTDAVITGVMAEMWTTSSLATSALNPSTYSNEIYLIKGGAISGNNKALGDGDDVDASNSLVASMWQVGGTTDLWGNTLTPSDVNASDFGVSLQFFIDQDANNDVYLIRCSLAVAYEPAPILLGGIIG